MDYEECQEVFDQLASYLGENGIGWIAEQIDEQIRLGKIVSKQIKVSRSRGDSFERVSYAVVEPTSGKSRSQGTSSVQQTEEYTEDERLRLLIGAIRQTILDAGEMERETTAFLAESGQASLVEFADESRTGKDYEANSIVSNDKRSAEERLISLLNDLEAEI